MISCKTKNKFIVFLKFFWKIFSKQIILYLLILLCAILVGILTASSFTASVKITMLSDKIFLAFISLKSSFWGLLFGYLILYSLVFIFGIFFYKFVFVLFQMLIFVCFGYLLGFDIIIACSTFSVLSIVLYLLIYVVCKLSILLLLSVILAINAKKWWEQKKFGCFCFNNFYRLNLKQLYLFLYVVLLVNIIVLSLLCGVFNFTQIA